MNKKETKKQAKVINNTPKRDYTRIFFFMLGLSSLMFGGLLLWQWRIDFMAITDALSVTALLLLFIGWIIFVYNQNVLSPLIHGTKTFALMLIGRKPKEDYFTYTQSISEDPVPKFYIYMFLVSGLILLVPSIVMIIIASR